LFLQRTLGNRAVQRLFESGFVQTELKIGQPGDKYEQEADRVADVVMRMPEAQMQRQAEEEEEELVQPKRLAEQIMPFVQRQVEEEEEEPIQTKMASESQVQSQKEELEEEEEEPIQTKPIGGKNPQSGPGFEAQIRSVRGCGHPLPDSARSFFEPRFGCDFSQVRVHPDRQAAEIARTVNSQAFTIGRDVVFGKEQYSPETASGKRLLAHELAHVIQQKNSVPMVQRKKGMAAKGKTIFRKTKYKTYPLKAKTLKEAVEEMKKAYGDEAGKCEWSTSLSYSYDEKGTITKAEAVIKTEITLPKWPGAKNVKKAARVEWNRFRKALKKHEEGHASLVREKLKGLAASLVGKSKEDAENAYQEALDALQKASDAYDVETDHGRNQGTTIDLSKEK
jgi:predicted secreted Zn-dependent protease